METMIELLCTVIKERHNFNLADIVVTFLVTVIEEEGRRLFFQKMSYLLCLQKISSSFFSNLQTHLRLGSNVAPDSEFREAVRSSFGAVLERVAEFVQAPDCFEHHDAKPTWAALSF